MGTLVFSTNKTNWHDITEILLKMVFTTITLSPPFRPLCSLISDAKKSSVQHLWAVLLLYIWQQPVKIENLLIILIFEQIDYLFPILQQFPVLETKQISQISMYYVKTRADNSGYTNHRITCLVVMCSSFDNEQAICPCFDIVHRN
jgi:hypothetical protein